MGIIVNMISLRGSGFTRSRVTQISRRWFAQPKPKHQPYQPKPSTSRKTLEEPIPPQIPSQAVGGKLGTGQIIFNVAAFGVGIYLISKFIFNTQYKNTGAYKMSMKLLETHPDVIDHIGVPVQPGYNITGRRYDGNKLYLEWKISGPGGQARVICRNAFVARKGSIEELTATFQNGDVLTVVGEENPV